MLAIASLLITLPVLVLASVSDAATGSQPNLIAHPASGPAITEIARRVTVRIVTDPGVGAGVIIARHGQTYTVLTCGHVVADSKDNNYQLQKRFSSSQNVNFFLSLINRDGVKLPFNLKAPSPEAIKRGLRGNEIKALVQASGKVEFDASADVLEDPQDVVKDIYKAYSFQLGNLLRDCPSGGVGSVLLGDRNSNCSGL